MPSFVKGLFCSAVASALTWPPFNRLKRNKMFDVRTVGWRLGDQNWEKQRDTYSFSIFFFCSSVGGGGT